MKIKTLLFTLLCITSFFINTEATAKGLQFVRLNNLLNDVATLSEQFNLSNEQKIEIKSVLLDYLPKIALNANSMLNNRQDLLSKTIKTDDLDEELVTEIARKQGTLLTTIIIQKEHMKKEMRLILTAEQKEFVDALIDTIIHYRLNQS